MVCYHFGALRSESEGLDSDDMALSVENNLFAAHIDNVFMFDI